MAACDTPGDGLPTDGLSLSSLAPPDGPREGDAVLADAEAVLGLLRELRAEMAHVTHAVSNPLTVITGNAQFALEMARCQALDPVVVRSLEDIEAAGRALAHELAALAALRQRIATATGTADRL